MRHALIALAVLAAFVAAALVARAERVYSHREVNSAFASESLSLGLPGPVGLLPGCPPAWSTQRWAFWTAPTPWCVQGVLATGSGSAVIYVFPSEWDAGRYVRSVDYEQVANLLVLVQDWHPSVGRALDALEEAG